MVPLFSEFTQQAFLNVCVGILNIQISHVKYCLLLCSAFKKVYWGMLLHLNSACVRVDVSVYVRCNRTASDVVLLT